MKMHAAAGADILSAISFPYPVVPIVRHHHENWDGTGYPDGLRGTDIPIGARILAVIDCFDALPLTGHIDDVYPTVRLWTFCCSGGERCTIRWSSTPLPA